MKTRTIVTTLAAGSLLLGNVSAFAQAEAAQERQQQYQKAREQGNWHPDDPSNPRPGASPRVQQPNDRRGGNPGVGQRDDNRRDPGYAQRDDNRRDPGYGQRNDNRRDPGYGQRDDTRYDPRYYQRWDQNGGRYVPGDRAGGDWRGRGAGPNHDWYRGAALPREYRSRQYVVDDWRSHRLYAPPRGYQWVQAGGDYVLVAVATGIIASILLNQ
jgi:Ni/Co efflux regulator RcnB